MLNGVSYQYFALDQFLLEPFCTKFWRRKWQPTLVFLSRESCGRRSLVGCVHRVAQSQTRLKRLSIHACIGEGNDNPLQYSCLENPRDRGAWWAAVYGVAQSQTWLKRHSMHACIGEGNDNPLQYSCLENPRDCGAWWAAIYGVAQSQTRLKQLSSSSSKEKLPTCLVVSDSWQPFGL